MNFGPLKSEYLPGASKKGSPFLKQNCGRIKQDEASGYILLFRRKILVYYFLLLVEGFKSYDQKSGFRLF